MSYRQSYAEQAWLADVDSIHIKYSELTCQESEQGGEDCNGSFELYPLPWYSVVELICQECGAITEEAAGRCESEAAVYY